MAWLSNQKIPSINDSESTAAEERQADELAIFVACRVVSTGNPNRRTHTPESHGSKDQ